MSKPNQLPAIIKQATQLLQSHAATTYTQQDIVDRLDWVEHGVSPSFFNKVLKWEEGSTKYLQRIKDGLNIIIGCELGYEYDESEEKYVEISDPKHRRRRITRSGLLTEGTEQESTSVKVHSTGRLSLEKKVRFFAEAKKEVLFFGVRLKQLASYFMGRKGSDFKEPIKGLLSQGVHVRCYMLDPTWEGASYYFEDRGTHLEREKRSLKEMNLVAADLKSIVEEYKGVELSGKLEVLVYRHFPQGYYLVVDGEEEGAKMQFAPYLFGLPRSESPVQEIHRKEQPILFEKYWNSLNKLIEHATPLS